MAFYILTPQFMENIIKADALADGYTNIRFKGTDVVLAIVDEILAKDRLFE